MSDEAKHTPGPWKLTTPTLVIGPPSDKPRGVVADCSNVTIGVEAKANARLIAAAPDLLTALEAMSALYTFAWDRVDGGLTMMASGVEHFEKTHELAQDAIAKAIGKQ